MSGHLQWEWIVPVGFYGLTDVTPVEVGVEESSFIMEDFEKFYNVALRFLSYRPRSEKEVISHFAKASKGQGQSPSEEVIEKVIQKLKEQKFIDDGEFAKWWIESRTRFKPRSLRLIKMELRQKGIEQDLIDNLINNSRFTINDLENAKKLVEKKMWRFRNPTSPHSTSSGLRGASKFGMTREKIYEKLGRFLASKGFDWDTIKKSIDEVLDKGV